MALFYSFPGKPPNQAFDVIYFQKILPGFKREKFIHVRTCYEISQIYRRFINGALPICLLLLYLATI